VAHVTAYWACQKIGAIATPLNWRYSEGEARYCIGDAAAVVVMFEAASRDAVLGARNGLAGVRAWIYVGNDAPPDTVPFDALVAERCARVPAGLESRGGGPAHRGGANHIAVSRADALPRSGVAARSHAIRREQRDHARLRGRADGEHARARRRARVPAPQIPEP